MKNRIFLALFAVALAGFAAVSVELVDDKSGQVERVR